VKVSIVTISFNQGRYLARAIASVVGQDYPDIEYIVVDAGSTDGSRDIVEQYRGSVSRVVLEPDRGPGDGLNKGFSLATGSVFAYLNADDELLPGAVRRAVQALGARPWAGAVVGHGYVVDATGAVLRCVRSPKFGARRFAYGIGVVMQQSTFIRREAFEAVGGFNNDNRTSWDAELLVGIALNGYPVERVNEYWSLFRIHPASITGSQAWKQLSIKNHQRLFRRVMGREPNRLDLAISKAARVLRWAEDPAGALARIRDMTVGPPQGVGWPARPSTKESRRV
jgi:glycosyltransferase involved in cell wall biosynthesis